MQIRFKLDANTSNGNYEAGKVYHVENAWARRYIDWGLAEPYEVAPETTAEPTPEGNTDADASAPDSETEGDEGDAVISGEPAAPEGEEAEALLSAEDFQALGWNKARSYIKDSDIDLEYSSADELWAAYAAHLLSLQEG